MPRCFLVPTLMTSYIHKKKISIFTRPRKSLKLCPWDFLSFSQALLFLWDITGFISLARGTYNTLILLATFKVNSLPWRSFCISRFCPSQRLEIQSKTIQAVRILSSKEPSYLSNVWLTHKVKRYSNRHSERTTTYIIYI